jgi:hypothetical protein
MQHKSPYTRGILLYHPDLHCVYCAIVAAPHLLHLKHFAVRPFAHHAQQLEIFQSDASPSAARGGGGGGKVGGGGPVHFKHQANDGITTPSSIRANHLR